MEEEIIRTYDIDKKPRMLKAEEIECRVGTINGKGCSLLLYKDARVDMKILDETYGVGNWQRTHEVINDNLFCTIEIWNDKINQWVKKQDVGTESYTEKEKGEASDSFKRAGFNVGIGRELYTSPFIWIQPKADMKPYNTKDVEGQEANEFLAKIREKNGKYLFVTNNSSKGVDAYVAKLAKLGILATADDFLTSTDATILYLNTNFHGKKFYSMGTKSFTEQLKNAGVNVTTELEDDIFGLVISNDTELTFKKLDDACILLGRGVEYIATNPDWVCPTWYGYVPDCGCFAEMLERATGRKPIFIGKPKPEMLLLAMEKYGYSKEESVMIGDRVYTDIASGYNAGIDTIFVLSGEGTVKDAEASDTKPTYIIENIREVYNRIK